MLIITGTVAYDYIMDFPGKFGDHILPDKIHQINLAFNVSKFAKRRGGTAGNVSYSLGLLQIPHILFAAAGKDFEDYKKDFLKLNINLDYVKIDKMNYTSTGFAMADKLDNQIWGYFLGASEKNYKLNLSQVAKKSDLVLVGPTGAKGSMSFISQCVRLGIDYMFDPGFILTEVKDSQLEFGIKNAKYIIGNDYEIALIKMRVKNFEEIVKNKIFITTLGEKGAVISDGNNIIEIKSAKINKIVDPTGAGDAWRSGFLTGLQKGFDLQICGQMGSVASAYAIENYGSQEHKYTKQEFENRYRQTFGTLIKL
ncbi:MAG: Adenosine kinase [Candidatus Levybacteria bacterium]|nr:Adenosine kinase [Candidatus Levybacteria bacterium]